MSQLDDALADLKAHHGVEHLLLLGTDGLLIQHLGDGTPLEAETVAAMVPGIATACGSFGRASHRGEFSTAVLEFDGGVAIVTPLSAELYLALVVREGVGFAPLLREVRRDRRRLAELL